MKAGLLAVILMLLTSPLYPQLTTAEQQTIEDLIEEIAQSTDLELDYTLLYEDLLQLRDHPLNINTADAAQLERIQFLNDFQIRNLLAYIRINGPLLSWSELLLIEGFDPGLVQLLIPFIRFTEAGKDEKLVWREAIPAGTHQLIVRLDQVLQEQEGYSPISGSAYQDNPDARYLGSPVKLVTRYRYHYRDRIYWGITGEKDAGEEFLSGSNRYGFDFYSGHLVFHNPGRIKTLALGDYHARFGQGLTLWTGLSYGKTPYALNIQKKSFGLTKYASTDENRFLRGLGTTVKLGDFDLTTFISRKMIDANTAITDTLTEDIDHVTSFQVTGYHSIPSEIADEDAIRETILGGNISYGKGNIHLGLTLVNYRFDKEILPAEKPYNTFAFRGTGNTNAGVDYRIGLDKVNFFGEFSWSLNHGIAFLNGMVLNIHSLVSLALLHRDYKKDYYPFYSQAVSENTTNVNEQGLYLGTEIRPLRYLKLSAYFDIFRFPWLKYNVDAPSEGTDYLVRADFNPNEHTGMYLMVKGESKPRNKAVDYPSLGEIEDTDLLKIRYHLSHSVSEGFEVQTRIELSWFRQGDEPSEKGYLVFQDLLFRPPDLPVSVSLRYAVFDTDSWDARIYTYEHDLLYAFSIPAFHSKGIRTYLLVKYSPLDNLDLWFRLAQTYYSELESIGSGLNEISGNTRTDLKVQVQLRF